MKKITRRMLGVAGGASVLVVVGLSFSLDRVDYRPYFTAPYYTETRERWQHQATNHHSVRGALEAGFGRAALMSPRNPVGDGLTNGLPRSVPLAGYGERRGHPATGIHDELWVKAVAFRVADQCAVLVSADALIVPREVTELAMARVRQQLGLRREQVYLGATHTHSSLGGWGEGWVQEQFAGPFQPEVRTWFADRLAEAIRAALSDLRPASAGHARVSAPAWVSNRLVGDRGRVDPELSFLVVKQAEGKTAVLGAYAAHATLLPASNLEFSGDYPGYWQRAVEQATGGLALFFAGGVGSHRPQADARGFTGAERMGYGLAQLVLDRLPAIPLQSEVTLGLTSLNVTLPELQVRVAESRRLRPWLASRLLRCSTQVLLQVFRLNEVCWISTPCDFSGELALTLKESCRSRGFDALVTSFNGDYVGYVIPSRYYHLAGYESQLMSFFGPHTADYFEDLLRRMLATLELR